MQCQANDDIVTDDTAGAQYGFHHLGTAILSLNYAHILTPVNITDLATYILGAKRLSNILKKASIAHPNNADLQHLTGATMEEYAQLEAKYADVTNYYLKKTGTAPVAAITREKRFIGVLLAGLAGMVGGATLFGLFENGKLQALANGIEDLRFRQQKMIHLIEGLDNNIRTNAHNIKTISKVLDKVESMVSRNALAVEASILAIYTQHVISSLNQKLDVYVSAVQQAAAHRLAFGLLSYDEAAEALANAHAMAAMHNLNVLIDDPQQLFQLESSILFTEYGFIIMTHVPVTNSEMLLDLWKYSSFPFQLPDPNGRMQFYQIKPKDDVLAFNPKTMNYFVLNNLDVTLCHHVHNYYLCPTITFLYKAKMPNCLMSLFANDYDKAYDLCKLEASKYPDDYVLPLADQSMYKVYTANDNHMRVTCQDGSVDVKALPRFSKVKVPDKCYIDLTKFVLFPINDFTTKVPQRVYTGKVDHWAKRLETDHTEIHQMISSISNATYHPMDLHTLKLIKAAYPSLKGSWTWVDYSLYSVMGIAFLTCGCLAIGALRNFWKSRRNRGTPNTPVNINVSATAPPQELMPLQPPRPEALQ